MGAVAWRSLKVACTGCFLTTVAFIIYGNSKDSVKYEKIDREAIRYKGNIWTLTANPTHGSSVNASSSPVKITLQLVNGNKNWTCNIEGTITSSKDNSTLNLNNSLQEIKKRTGIRDNQSRSQDDEESSNFKKLFQNCIRHREIKPTDNNSTSTINLGEMKLTGGEYQFDETEIRNLYRGMYFDQKRKEKKLKITCPNKNGEDIACTFTKESLEGFTKKDDTSEITIVKKTIEGKVVYAISNSKEKDGNYKIERNWLGKFRFVKVK